MINIVKFFSVGITGIIISKKFKYIFSRSRKPPLTNEISTQTELTFKEKENKYFVNITGEAKELASIDTKNFSAQGIGRSVRKTSISYTTGDVVAGQNGEIIILGGGNIAVGPDYIISGGDIIYTPNPDGTVTVNGTNISGASGTGNTTGGTTISTGGGTVTVNDSATNTTGSFTDAGGDNTTVDNAYLKGRVDFPNVQYYGISGNLVSDGKPTEDGLFKLQLNIYDPVSQKQVEEGFLVPAAMDKASVVPSLQQLTDEVIWQFLNNTQKDIPLEELIKLEKASQTMQ